MPTPSEILEDHRKHLIARLVSRNPLLSFKPSKLGRGHKIDICDLFPQKKPLITFNNGAEQEENEGCAQTASGFFRQIIENGEASFRIEKPALARQVRKIRAEAQDLKRATGLHLLYFAWPFVHIPANICGRKKAIAAPLLFWPIELKFSKQLCTVVGLHKDESEYNFILEAWLKLKGCNLDFSQFEGKSIDEISNLVEETFASKMTLGVHACINKITDPYEFSPYNDEDNTPAILPTAALGIAGFNSRTLLNDLEELAAIADTDNDHGLLNIFLRDLLKNEDVRQPPEVDEPGNETDKHLVEKTDSSQEAVVWQAQHENAKVMFLKGPPGTGKSQTIVNLIADALNRNESVAVVCHKQPALDVVKKRLDATHLGKLATKIINPRNEQRNFIRGIKNTPMDDFLSLLPRNRNDKIKTLEIACYKQSESRMGNSEKYSIKGHLRGRIKKLSEITGFNPFVTLNNNQQSIINTIKEKFDNSLPDEHTQNDFLEKIAGFSQDYKECDFINNPWRESNRNENDMNAVTEIGGNFNALAQTAKELDNERNNLPNERISALLFGVIINPWAAGFYVGENHEIVANYSRLIADTKKVFARAKMEAPKIWEEIYQGEGGNEYRRYADNVHHLQLIASIKSRRRDSGVLDAFMNYKSIKPVHWRDVLDIIFCHWQFEDMKVPSLVHYDREIGELKSLIENKRRDDARKVLNQYDKRQDAKNWLSGNDLLRLRGGGGHQATTIRKLYESGGDNVTKIYPVLLANPDTICQITPMQKGYFDLVIIDEASQMFSADALPILYRANKIIISGDNMQMPPDNAFAMFLDDQDDDNDDEEKQEEITAHEMPKGSPPASGRYKLLEMIEHFLPDGSSARRELNIHYRSRPSELIAFSNHAFYDGKLQAATDNGVLPESFEQPFKLLQIPGKFNKGTNEAEIESIINELRKLWKLEKPPSVGVIVFNVKQARAVNGRLFEECENDADFKEKYDAALSREDDGEDAGFFVRSVEHVQGDERDIIILATTYDDDTRGFGPLSIKEKGRRRLNVAVTRAKLSMIVITSLTINKISNEGQKPALDEQQGKERWYLWKFMQYVRAVANGEHENSVEILRTINPEYHQPAIGTGDAESQFERDVGNFIQEKGYAVDYQIGESGFRIDLGVKQKQDDSTYLCGVECDGRIWHDGWRARHNDIWRQEILEAKGWSIYRIWSDHWYNNPQGTQQALLNHLFERAQG